MIGEPRPSQLARQGTLGRLTGPDHAKLLQGEVFFHHFEQMEPIVPIDFQVPLVVGLQGNLHAVFIGKGEDRFHQPARHTLPPFGGPHCKVHHMQPGRFAQIFGPLGVEVLLPPG